MKIARSSLAEIRSEHVESRKKLAEEILVRAHEREKERVLKKGNVAVKRVKAIEAVASSGIVTDSVGISSLLHSLSAPARLKALCAQIRFRERALRQEAPEERIFVLTNKGSPLSENELRRRLEFLIEDDLKGLVVTRSLPSTLIGCWIRRWIDDRSEDGKVVSAETKGPFSTISIKFPSSLLSFPLVRFEEELENGYFELLDESL
ncbi:hypothetical protein PRIPAC_97802 [Pristionchus pacificus]|uniref:Uncharacterized protein n=1 Tax=Pristionchus pacificus TaxID=54126 RepID=A0A2A6B2E0_PRIPA|nr:hypothetical protein PRIPAC_97802 [Pristionchus pacificus]|eukprot:PDM60029.1 hypothetical protein PRIPAC_49315 [Pristionchus pacificus]